MDRLQNLNKKQKWGLGIGIVVIVFLLIFFIHKKTAPINPFKGVENIRITRASDGSYEYNFPDSDWDKIYTNVHIAIAKAKYPKAVKFAENNPGDWDDDQYDNLAKIIGEDNDFADDVKEVTDSISFDDSKENQIRVYCKLSAAKAKEYDISLQGETFNVNTN